MNFVSEIVAAINTEIESILPSQSLLDYIYDIESNSFTGQDIRYGVIPQEAPFSDGQTNCSYMLDHKFQVILARNYFNSGGDEDMRNTIYDLYSDMDAIAHSLIWQKLNKAYIVKIDYLGMEEPEDGDNVAVLRGNFSIK